MGLFTVPATLVGPTGRTEHLDLLVDTGSHFLMLPKGIADRLELVPTRTIRLELAGGSRAPWPLAEVRLALGDIDIGTECLITPGGRPILGCLPLEQLFLKVDPVAKRLVPDVVIGRPA